VGNESSTASVDSPTPAVTLVAGPRHYYDTTTMFQFTNNVPDSCPLPKLFRALYSIRDDDILRIVKVLAAKSERDIPLLLKMN
jgi:hypothetical protein